MKDNKPQDSFQLPKIGLDTAGVSEQDSFDFWMDMNRPFSSLHRADFKIAPSSWDVRAYKLVNSIFMYFENGPIRFVRTRTHVARSEAEYIVVRLCVSGSQTNYFAESTINTNQGDILISDMSMALSAESKAGSSDYCICVPYEVVGYKPGVNVLPKFLHAQSPQAQLVSCALKTFAATIDNCQPQDVEMFENGMFALLRTLLSFDRNAALSSVDSSRTRLKMIQQHIEENLEDPSLDSVTLCKKFGASRATLYRMFSELGGVAKYINERRLAAVHRELQLSATKRGQVRQIAERWCFFDQSQFSRSFKKRFDTRPRAVLGRMVDTTLDAAEIADTTQRHHFGWMR